MKIDNFKQTFNCMNFKYLTFLVVFLSSFLLNAQNNNKVLFTIDKEPIYTKDFLSVYNKNLNLMEESSQNAVENYLELYVNYKLKVKEAFELQLDTTQKFKNELSQYKINLTAPYLKDKEVSKKLIEEGYERITKEVEVSHILLFLKPDASPNDTLAAYNKLLEARNLVKEGMDFNEVALKYSEDPSVAQNGGKIGYFTGFQMVYPFENMAYNTQINEVSMPFKTKFGYHILKVHNVRKSNGEVEVTHIMIKNESLIAKTKIDSIYKEITLGNKDFFEVAEQISDDKASAVKGGRLDKFGSGRMVESFADECFKLENEGDISKPFQTQFGWHIVKLLKKYPIESFDLLKDKIAEQVAKDERSNLVGESVIKRLFNDYKITVNEKSLKQFDTDNWKENPEKFKSVLLTIEQSEIPQSNFISYLKSTRPNSVNNSFVEFKEKEVLNYYTQNIEKLNPEFAAMFSEFKEGLLLFDLLETKVWEKSKDSVGLSNFFNENKSNKYNNKELKEIKGKVISDFQNYLEQQWIRDLHLKYKVEFNNLEKDRILKTKI